ncbi:hypothetical protein HPB47_007927 [Ixodes persulcatus]|uniref:Uncharacterized protein n=1 Tax=Ixodes persulcatus TaxID=34615 RepID=A0AC60P6K7_IXOPE|nr:hypothetical protein HPB47_007927 [Ixodes persulcatus]
MLGPGRQVESALDFGLAPREGPHGVSKTRFRTKPSYTVVRTKHSPVFMARLADRPACPGSQQATVVSGEASESDEDETTCSSTTASELASSEVATDGPTKAYCTASCASATASLRRNLTDVARQPYQNAARELSGVTQGLIRSQELVQEVSSTLRRVTNTLFQLEDKLDTIRHCSIIPVITISR